MFARTGWLMFGLQVQGGARMPREAFDGRISFGSAFKIPRMMYDMAEATGESRLGQPFSNDIQFLSEETDVWTWHHPRCGRRVLGRGSRHALQILDRRDEPTGTGR